MCIYIHTFFFFCEEQNKVGKMICRLSCLMFGRRIKRSFICKPALSNAWDMIMSSCLCYQSVHLEHYIWQTSLSLSLYMCTVLCLSPVLIMFVFLGHKLYVYL